MAEIKGSRCAHCGHRIRNARYDILRGGEVAGSYHGDRRACRRAFHEAFERPERTGLPFALADLDTETLGAGLIAVDYVRLPWWARLAPGSWVDGLLRDAAVQIGGAVQSKARERTAR